ncbi:MAG: hypothetical protein K2Q06_01385, partial [Parvularculaceae bacterium]|nr:hypothetical protein [Parvularculaceae bacterium]
EGAEWHQGEFTFEDRKLSYYDYVRRRLAAPGFRYNPVEELKHGLDEICGAIRDRKVAVDLAVDAKYPQRPAPDRLPPNIYGTYGDWEKFSTPSRDARLKVSFIELRREVERLYKKTVEGDPSMIYEGSDLAKDLWDAWTERKLACVTNYRRSDESRVGLHIGHVMDRLWDLSFDPHHCPERRWGAKGVELETCTDDAVKTRWYEAQKWLRFQAERTYDVRMDFRLDELKSPAVAKPEKGGIGVESPADHDIRAYLASLLPQPEATPVAQDETAPRVWRANETLPPDLWVPYWGRNHAEPAVDPLKDPARR